MSNTIKDSGARREFSTGSVRDIDEGKGRCDLLPLDVIANLLQSNIICDIASFMQTHEVLYLYDALHKFANEAYSGDEKTMILEVAIHFANGARKYGEYNWQKGIPIHCYIDSGVRHYLKWRRGDDDEPHDRAFVWNILCCIWTMKHIPEMNDLKTYTLEEVKEELGL